VTGEDPRSVLRCRSTIEAIGRCLMSNQPVPSRLRFSLRWLLALMAAAGIILGLFSFQAGQSLAIWLVHTLLRGVVPTAAVVGAMFARGDWRAFSLGALVASLPVLVAGTSGSFYDPCSAILKIGGQLASVAICGVFAVAARRWLVREGLDKDA